MQLTSEQKLAVEHPEVPLLILAGPGSGKTTVLTYRCLWLIEQGVDPRRLFVVTFTNKAANELKSRLQRMIGARAQEIYAGTFHSLCARWLRRHSQAVGGGWSIVDDREAIRILRKVLEQGKYQVEEEVARTSIALAKANLMRPEDLENRVIAEIYEAYDEELKKMGGMDFGDLVAKFVEALKQNPDLLSKAQSEFDHVLVDEFQDINRAQDEAIRLLAQGHRRITCVGDMDQAIFGFQGGCLEAMMRFKEHWPDGAVVSLSQNFRSTKTIVRAASHLIGNNRASSGLKAWTQNEEGDPIRTRPFISELDEADWVAEEIERLINRKENPESPSDIAVLVRVMAHAAPIEQALIQRRIPYEVVGSRPFLEYPEIREAVLYLKLLADPFDAVAFRQFMALHGVGLDLSGRVLERSRAVDMNPFDYIAYQLPFERYKPWEARKLMTVRGAYNRVATKAALGLAGAIQEISHVSRVLEGLKDEMDEMEEAEVRLEWLTRLASHFEASHKGAVSLTSFLSYLLSDDGEELDPQAPRVQILSIHRAKGLEWNHVFIVGATADTLPHQQSLAERGEEAIEEERRLFYVALTRAKKTVSVTWPLSRQRSSARIERTLSSPFINELPKECVQSALAGTVHT